MIVYHGGTEVVTQPLVSIGRSQLDFGQGFYLTDLMEQAKAWAIRMALHRHTPALVNQYILDIDRVRHNYRYQKFHEYDRQWLEFIVNNRRGGYSWQNYDLIEGGVADDRVIDTVELYMGNYLSEEEAIKRLIHLAPNNQLCITNQKIISECLQYVDCITIEND